MAFSSMLFLWLQLSFLVLFLTSFVAAADQWHIPRLSPHSSSDITTALNSLPSDDFKTLYYKQTLDHFNYRPESYVRFKQRYIINFRHWGGAKNNAPILAWLGAEAPVNPDPAVIGFMTENASRFKALLVYLEHRYYGKSIPFGSRKQAFTNASTLGYFNSAQALADYAEILIHLKKKLHAMNSPLIVIGGSYSGMLAAYFRLKYPHIAIGALASSAPILYFDNLTPHEGYYDGVTKDFKEVSKTCYKTISQSWTRITEVSKEPNGLEKLSKYFNTCSPLRNVNELIAYLGSMYSEAAQYDRPPNYPVNIVCDAIDKASSEDDIISKIVRGMHAFYELVYHQNKSCYVNEPDKRTEVTEGWRWLTCSELVLPLSRGKKSMFPRESFNLKSWDKFCRKHYSVPSRPHWITTYYGGQDIKLVLKNFGSNIIFSNGLRDPYSVGGILENISDTIVAIKAINGSHCLDIVHSQNSDPEWLKSMRKTEVEVIEDWFSKYYKDLHAYKKRKSY